MLHAFFGAAQSLPAYHLGRAQHPQQRGRPRQHLQPSQPIFLTAGSSPWSSALGRLIHVHKVAVSSTQESASNSSEKNCISNQKQHEEDVLQALNGDLQKECAVLVAVACGQMKSICDINARGLCAV